MKALIFIVMAVFSLAISNAQIRFAIKAGANFSILHTSSPIPEVSYQYTPNINAGASISIPLPGKFLLQPELMYSVQGSKVNTNAENLTDKFRFVNVPVLLKYQIADGFFAELGPQAGFLLSARKKVNSSSLPPGDPALDQAGDNKAIKNYKSACISGIIGIGYVSTANIGLDLRYSAGLTNIAKPASVTIDGTPFATSNSSYRNNSFQFDVFYIFGKKKK